MPKHAKCFTKDRYFLNPEPGKRKREKVSAKKPMESKSNDKATKISIIYN